MSYEFILAETAGSVMKIILNRPDVLNAFTLAMSREVCDALSTARNLSLIHI